MVSRTATGGRSRSVEKMIHRARSAELSTALWRKCLPRRCGHLCWCCPFEGHDIPFRYSARCAGARRHDWPRRAADAPRARRRRHRIERGFTALPYVGFWHKADLPRCLLFVRSRGQSGQADLTAFFLIPARTNEKPRPYVTADVVSGKPATKGSASTSRHGHTCEVPPTRKEVNASPRAQSCSHRSDLP